MRLVYPLTLAWLVTALTAQAGSPPLPVATSLPETAYAEVVVADGKTTLVIRRVESGTIQHHYQVAGFVDETRIVDGKPVTTKVPTTASVNIGEPIPTRWRETKVDAADIKIGTVAGETLTEEEWRKRLAKPTPVITTTDDPVDPVLVATLKPDTLVVIGTKEKLHPPREPGVKPPLRKVKMTQIVDGRPVTVERDPFPSGFTPAADVVIAPAEEFKPREEPADAADGSPALPKNPYVPRIAFASVATEGESTILSTHLLMAGERNGTRTSTTYRTERRIENGKPVDVQVPVTVTEQLTGFGVTGWHEVKVPLGESLHIQDVAGKKIEPAEAARRLAESTPVVLSFAGTPDPFFLSNVKPDTLIVIGHQNDFFPNPRNRKRGESRKGGSGSGGEIERLRIE